MATKTVLGKGKETEKPEPKRKMSTEKPAKTEKSKEKGVRVTFDPNEDLKSFGT